MICPKPPARSGRFNAFLATFMHLMVLREADADYPEFIDGEAAENNAPESGNESENESESNVNPPLQPNRDQRRATTRNMFDTAFQNGAIIDGTTVFTFTPQPQASAQSTTTTYTATFPGPDGRPKNVFIALCRAVAGGGKATPHTASHKLILSHLCSYRHTRPCSLCAGFGPAWRTMWRHGVTPTWKSVAEWQGTPVSNRDVDPDNRFVASDFCLALENLTKAALLNAHKHSTDMLSWFRRSEPAVTSAPIPILAYDCLLFALATFLHRACSSA